MRGTVGGLVVGAVVSFATPAFAADAPAGVSAIMIALEEGPSAPPPFAPPSPEVLYREGLSQRRMGTAFTAIGGTFAGFAVVGSGLAIFDLSTCRFECMAYLLYGGVGLVSASIAIPSLLIGIPMQRAGRRKMVQALPYLEPGWDQRPHRAGLVVSGRF